jgi:adenine/guanine phosphoribosyltransferase-like PRPP-binding protein
MADPPLDLKSYIRDVPDFPQPGVLFHDVTPARRWRQLFGHDFPLY